ncbi:ABC transporter substrate-binding protein [Konateibacter massiliensis]|uniref:ABC transporter substrate-binding protein n=1 Tax=Konateibacter massiliensis TaxID=2002841 RepID=UPI000C15E657|nr:ABC transporter substrate-binding protein [Konateibacter massiliensis]
MKKNLYIKAIASLSALAIVAVGLTGCAGNKADTSASSQSTSSTEAADAETENNSTKIVSTVMGDVEVPVNPQRVIATYGMGDVIALGVIPVATYDVTGTAYEKEVEQLPVWDGFESEEIMSYDPDLILVVNQEQYDEASKIAPTILIPFTELSMEERITFLGEILGKEEEAKAALSDFEGKINNAKAEMETMGIADSTFSIFEASENGIWVYGDKWGRGGDILYSHLKLNAPEVIQSEIIGKDQYRDVSLEAINDYAGDFIVFSGNLGDLEDNPVWNSIPAVKDGKIIPIDFTLFYDIDIYSSNVQLDYLMEKLKEITQ